MRVTLLGLLFLSACGAPRADHRPPKASAGAPAVAPPVASPVASPTGAAAPESAAAAPTWLQASALEATPACVPMPAAPSTQRPGKAAEAEAVPTEIARNESVGARLPEVGDRAVFAFASDAGEQSLFEVAGFGYSRAAKGRALLAVTDAENRVLWQNEREAGAQWRDFCAFVAPAAGTYSISIAVLEGGFRFALVRHSNYAPLGAEALDLGSLEQVHGHLPNADAVARFRLPVSAGEELAVKLAGTREEAREEARRGAAEATAMAAGMQPMREGAAAGRGAPKPLFQLFALEVVEPKGPARGPEAQAGPGQDVVPGPYRRLVARESGFLEVRVRVRRPIVGGGQGGGLFDLTVERNLAPIEVSGVVVDHEDEPLAGVELLFVREPDADPIWRARTDGAGRYTASLLHGDLAVQMVGERRAAQSLVRVRVDRPGVLDLVFLPGARVGGR
jgi:hypothetical protein